MENMVLPKLRHAQQPRGSLNQCRRKPNRLLPLLENGAFTQSTMEEMIDFAFPIQEHYGSEEAAKKALQEWFPAERWKK